jgi:hypothetical protein
MLKTIQRTKGATTYNANTHSRRKRVYWNGAPISTAGAYSTEEIRCVRIDSRTYKKNAGMFVLIPYCYRCYRHFIVFKSEYNDAHQ